MDKLEALAPITRLSKHAIRVLGQNPGKFTLQGTNTYILGSKNPYILLDTGQEDTSPSYLPFLRNALTDPSLAPLTNPDKPHISDIIISHWHHDHVGGLPGVLSLLKDLSPEGRTFTPPKIHKHPLSTALSSEQDTVLQRTLTALPRDLYTTSSSDHFFHDLTDGQILPLPGDEDGALTVLFTPGHTSDSIALLLPFDNALYTADTVLGQGTAVFEDLAKYIASLRRLLATESYKVLYPGHGPVVSDGKVTIETYIKHRLERETQVVAALKQPPPNSERWTTWSLVQSIYASYPESLWLPAAHGITLHLRKLEEDGVVKKVSGEGKDSAWDVI